MSPVGSFWKRPSTNSDAVATAPAATPSALDHPRRCRRNSHQKTSPLNSLIVFPRAICQESLLENSPCTHGKRPIFGPSSFFKSAMMCNRAAAAAWSSFRDKIVAQPWPALLAGRPPPGGNQPHAVAGWDAIIGGEGKWFPRPQQASQGHSRPFQEGKPRLLVG